MNVPANIVLNILKEEKCAGFLQQWSNARHESKLRGIYMLSQYDNHAKITQNFLVKTIPGGYSLLTWRDSGEEVVLDVCGLLTMSSLPPVGRRGLPITPNDGKRSHTVCLVGPNSAEFAKAIAARKKIYKYFQDTVHEGDVRDLPEYVFGDLEGIQAETRYLTPTSNNIFNTLELNDLNDPNGGLRRMTQSGKLVYTDDNVISFAMVSEDPDESLSRKEAHPGIFRRGQLVEASMTFRLSHAGPQYSFLTHLDSLLLVNRFGADAILEYQGEQQKKTAAVAQKVNIPKRRIHNDQDHIEEEKRVLKRAKNTVDILQLALPPSDAMYEGA